MAMTPAPTGDPEYAKLIQPFAEKLEGHMCFVAEWFSEDLPLEDKDGDNTTREVERIVKAAYGSSPRFANFLKPLEQVPEVEPSIKPAKESVLMFCDECGFGKGILDNAPDDRIGQKRVVTGPWDKYSQEDVMKLLDNSKKGWDKIIFCASCDAPPSNTISDIIEFQTVVSRLFFYVVKEGQRLGDELCRKIVCVVRGAWHDSAELHEEVGISLITFANMFGFCNSTRLELEGIPLHYIDTEYHLEPPSFMNADFQLLPRLSSEVFRKCTCGHNSVRILNEGRYVLRQVLSTEYEKANVSFEMPDHGTIGVAGGNGALGLVMGEWLLKKAKEQGRSGLTIKFLSRSMKVADDNMARWKTMQKQAAALGIHIEQSKMDMSSQQAVDQWVTEHSPDITGFIHSAGVLQDTMLMNLTWEKFEIVWSSKHRPALFLHDAFERMANPGLKFFWNFSSTSAYGNMGQINYSASNSYLDGMSRHRRAMGLPGCTMQWGAWGEVGMAMNMDAGSKRRAEQGPAPYFKVVEGLKGLEMGLRTNLPGFAVFKYNPGVMFHMTADASNTTAVYSRNFTSEIIPTPPLPASQDNLYTTLRMLGWPYIDRSIPLNLERWVLPLQAKQQEEDDLVW